MNKRGLGVGLWLALAGLSVTTVFGQAAGQTKKTVRRGVYNLRQAKSGAAVYQQRCSSCHLDSLEGGASESPALKGDDFLSHWNDKPLRELYSRIVSTMPANDPGTLSEKETLDVVAYILQKNGFPAGTKALQSADELGKIQFPQK